MRLTSTALVMDNCKYAIKSTTHTIGNIWVKGKGELNMLKSDQHLTKHGRGWVWQAGSMVVPVKKIGKDKFMMEM